ncbi:Peroxisome chaperone and import receptor [Pestalotiopsis sp. 9143b]|nr:Peroxisome chaperone and import receptor [Pestalotiopsis sp. 9143b]
MSTSGTNPAGDKVEAAAPSEHVNAPALDEVPDPDEDDLDDLDDLLDEFSAAKIEPKAAAAPTTAPTTAPSSSKPAEPKGPTIPTLTTDVPAIDPNDFSEEEFQRQLQAGMAELMGDFDEDAKMQEQISNLFKSLGKAGYLDPEDHPMEPPAGEASSSSQTKANPSADQVAADLSENASFQETIRKTMARMQASGDQATAAAAAEGSEDDFMAEMMKAMKDIPGADGSEEDFSKVLMGMMEQLTNKEILYEPMRELNEKFPGWMEKNGETLNKEDKERYEEQQRLVAEMVAKFEEPTYKDENVADREYVVDRMQKMQAAGSPPADLVGDMPSAKEVLDGPDDENCAPQ